MNEATRHETLHWQIDGEWLTNLARSWFWDEDRPYEKVAELLGGCIQTDDSTIKDTIVRDIIEGRKKFVGINEFELVDDNENIRPLTEKLEKLKRENAILKIKEDIRLNGIDYVDPYSTVKSVEAAKEKNVRSAEDCEIWFHYTDWAMRDAKRGDAIKIPAADTPTMAGLWLFEEPNMVYEATNHGEIHVDSHEFWQNIYELNKNREGFEFRNMLYITQKKMKEKHGELPESRTFTNEETNNRGYGEKPKKDNSLPSWSGLIAPNGDFYPCDYGAHESIAMRLLEEEFRETERNISFDALYNRSLSTLIKEKKWIACRYLPTRGHYVVYPGEDDVTSHWKPTPEQKDIIWKLVAIHHEKVNSETIPEIFF